MTDPLTVLIIEDCRSMRELLVRLLASDGYRCHEAENAAIGRQLFVRHRPQWVLMDIEMPGQDGIVATRELLADYPDARVIVITLHSSRDFRELSLSAGATAFVPKDELPSLLPLLSNSHPRSNSSHG